MISYTGWNTCVEHDGEKSTAGRIELRDIARGLAGALFVSLPLLFTMEMWQIARTMPDWVLITFLAITLVMNKLYLDFAGFRKWAWQSSKWWDAVVALGIGIVASAMTLFVTGSLHLGLDHYLMAKLVALTSIPMSIGAAVAVNQLGSGDSSAFEAEGLKLDLKIILGSLLGGILFAMNIAPTIEPKVIVLQQNWSLIGGTMLLSIAISYLTVSLANLENRDLQDRAIITSEWFEAVLAYAIAFLISMLLLWVFGYGTPLEPMEVWLPQAITLSYATTLGGAAGRLVL